MSLYYVQKFLYELNRSEQVQAEFRGDPTGTLESFVAEGATLTNEEITALLTPDIGMLFHLGCNGQILMHFAAFHQIEWQDYLQRMRDGIDAHGPVREGVYAMTGYEGTVAHAKALGHDGANERGASEHGASEGSANDHGAAPAPNQNGAN